METQKRFLLAIAGGSFVLMSLIACDSHPSRIATGEEVGAAVRNAEAQMVEARAKRMWRPCQSGQIARADTF